MIRITRQTDYGILVLARMASMSAHTVHTARDVARWSGIPRPMVSKILKTLARGGMLASHRGVKGGYSLAVHPDRITVGDVLRAMEGPVAMTECSARPGACDQEPVCLVRTNWQRLNVAVRQALERIPLQQMIAPNEARLDSLEAVPSGLLQIRT
jgi:FeS assembly SUF system regulator